MGMRLIRSTAISPGVLPDQACNSTRDQDQNWAIAWNLSGKARFESSSAHRLNAQNDAATSRRCLTLFAGLSLFDHTRLGPIVGAAHRGARGATLLTPKLNTSFDAGLRFCRDAVQLAGARTSRVRR